MTSLSCSIVVPGRLNRPVKGPTKGRDEMVPNECDGLEVAEPNEVSP